MPSMRNDRLLDALSINRFRPGNACLTASVGMEGISVMQTAQRDFEQTVRFAAASDRRAEGADRPRLRLALAVAGLAALVGWGVLDYARSAPSGDPGSITAAEHAPLDGRGKWTGYTSP